MVYTQEQLLTAVREAGRTGQPFSVGEVRAQLGLKSRDKRELKRFRSRLRECCQSLGTGIEKLGPHTFRLTAVALPPAVTKPVARAAATKKPVAAAPAAAAVERSALMDRVGITPRERAPDMPRTAAAQAQSVRAPREEAQLQLPVADDAHNKGLGSRVSAWLNRVRGREPNTAATALSRLALDLQPNAAHFQYQWVDGDLRVKVSGLGGRPRTADK